MKHMLTLLSLFIISLTPAWSTTVCWDGNIMAADSQGTWVAADGSIVGVEYNCVKIRSFNNQWYGTAGDVGAINDFFLWLQGGKPYPLHGGDFRILVVNESGSGYTYCRDSQIPVPVAAPFAMGSGGRLALGAMMSGVDAITAVKFAKKVDVYTGGPILSVHLTRK